MRNSVTTSTAILGLQQGVTFLASFGIHIVAGRVLGPDQYGLLSIVVALIAIIVFSILMGMPFAASQALARAGQLSRGILGTGLVVQVSLGLFLFAAVFLSADWLSAWFEQPGLSVLFKFAAVSIPLSAAAYFLIYCLNGLHRFGRQALGLSSITVFRLLLTILLLSCGLGLTGAVLAIPAAAAATLLFTVMLMRSVPRTQDPAPSDLLTRSAQFNTTFLLVTVWHYVDPVLLGACSTDPGSVGLFVAATSIAAAPEAIFTPLLVVLFPTLSRSAGRGDTEESRHYVTRAGFYIFALACPLVVGAAVLSEDLIMVLFGRAFLPVHVFVAPLTAAALLRVGFELGDTQIRATGNGALSMRNAGIAVAVHLAAAAVLVPAFGVLGMVIAVGLSSVVGLLLVTVYFRKKLGIGMPWTSAAKILAASLVAFLPLFLLDPPGVWAILASLPTLAVYVFILWTLGEVGQGDVRRLRRLTRELTRQWSPSPRQEGL